MLLRLEVAVLREIIQAMDEVCIARCKENAKTLSPPGLSAAACKVLSDRQYVITQIERPQGQLDRA